MVRSLAIAESPRLGRDGWIALGIAALKAEGEEGVTVDALCARARRTKGSFYHHFAGIGPFLEALVAAWIASETEAVAEASLAEGDSIERLRTMWRRTSETDHRFELGIRALALRHPAIAEAVRRTDDRREALMTELLGAAYRIPASEAAEFARLFHALHLSAQLRAPGAIADFSRGPVRMLVRVLEGRAAR